MNETKTKEPAFSKNDSLALKGVAIMMLLFFHLYGAENRFEKFTVSFAPLSADTAVLFFSYFKICVSVFAFITGYGLLISTKKSRSDLRQCGRQTASRVLKLMASFWLIYFPVLLATQVYDGYPLQTYRGETPFLTVSNAVLDFLGMAKLCGTPSLIDAWWYVGAAVIFIVLVPLAAAIARHTGYLSLLVLTVALPRLLGMGYPGNINPLTFLTPVLFGMLFAQYGLFEAIGSLRLGRHRAVSETLKFLLLLGLLIFSAFVWYKTDREQIWEYHFGIAPVVFIVFVRQYLLRIPLLKQGLIFLGRLSMDIFLTHSFIRSRYGKSIVYGSGNWLGNFFVLLAVSVVIALVIYYFKKLIRFDKLVGKCSEKLFAATDKA